MAYCCRQWVNGDTEKDENRDKRLACNYAANKKARPSFNNQKTLWVGARMM